MAKANPTVVVLGNGAPMMQENILHPDTGQVIGTRGYPAKHIQQSETRVKMDSEFDNREFVERTLSTDNDRELTMIARSLPQEHRGYAIGIQHLEHVWAVHSGNNVPDWVDCDDTGFAKAIAHHFGCPIGKPEALVTNAGRDYVHSQSFTTSYLALSANTSAESASNTTLPGEITTAGGGLVRGSATYAHTAGTNTTTLTRTFTANGSDSLPVVAAKVGVLTAATSGTLVNEKLLTTTSTLSTSGDNLTVTFTETAG